MTSKSSYHSSALWLKRGDKLGYPFGYEQNSKLLCPYRPLGLVSNLSLKTKIHIVWIECVDYTIKMVKSQYYYRIKELNLLRPDREPYIIWPVKWLSRLQRCSIAGRQPILTLHKFRRAG
jgi:hypothetical protein